MKKDKTTSLIIQDDRAGTSGKRKPLRIIFKADFASDAALSDINEAISRFVSENKAIIGKWDSKIK